MHAIQSHNYSGSADIPRMIALARHWEQENIHSTDLSYRLSSWALENRKNARLWSEGNQLVGWAVLQAPFWTIDYSFNPEMQGQLQPLILEWAEARILDMHGSRHQRPCWFTNTFRRQGATIRTLEAVGFICQSDAREDAWSKVFLVNTLEGGETQREASAGFSIRPLVGIEEVDHYVALHRRVFESRNMTVGWRRRTLSAPGYRADLDLAAEAPDGRLAAFCIGWISDHPSGRVGQIEPLGVHPDFRGLGLGKAILGEALRRFRVLGARHVVVETDRQRNAAAGLYEAMGFKLQEEILVFRKDYPA